MATSQEGAALTLFGKTIDSPVGALTLVAGADALVAVLWANEDPRRVPLGVFTANPDHPVLRLAERQLQEYFAGRRTRFSVPLFFSGTDFQQAVWAALREIPFGETRGYGHLAAALGRPSAARAVGAANGRNPISIIVPCHRLIGANGSLTGFAGGLEAKRYLLDLEERGRSA